MKGFTPPDDADLDAFTARLRERAFDPQCCFLCAHHFDETHITSEHVIPKWLQRRFDLWNQKLILLNRTNIPYRALTVPCCEECNSYRLQPIEIDMSDAVAKGPTAVRQLGPNTVFL